MNKTTMQATLLVPNNATMTRASNNEPTAARKHQLSSGKLATRSDLIFGTEFLSSRTIIKW
jgi:hypothetical protein